MDSLYVNVFDLLRIRPARKLVVGKLEQALIFPSLSDYWKKPNGLKLFNRLASKYLEGSLILYKFEKKGSRRPDLWSHVAVLEAVCEALMQGSAESIASQIVEDIIKRCELEGKERCRALLRVDVVTYRQEFLHYDAIAKSYYIFTKKKDWIASVKNIIGEKEPSALFSAEFAMITLIVNLVGVETICSGF